MTRARKPIAAPSLGPSNDDSPAVQIEMRAAELEETEHWEPRRVMTREGWGYLDHLSPGAEPAEDDHASNQDWLAGWLSGELERFDDRDQRDATAWTWDISRPLAEQLAETAADDAAADALAPAPVRCDWHPEHGADDMPTGQRCDATATHRIVWLDGSNRFSYGCDAHLELDPAAPPVRIEKLSDGSDGAP